MFTLIIGGSGSGKSLLAESLAVRSPLPRLYVATMEPADEEGRRRVARHRAQRAGKGFDTLECYTGLAGAVQHMGKQGIVLLECMSNLLANEMFSPGGGGSGAVLTGVEALLTRCADLVVVTNEVFSGGTDYEGDTLHYMRELAGINRALAQRADTVVEVLSGLPNVLKGVLA